MEKLRKSDLLEQVCSFGDKLLKQLFNTTRAELKKGTGFYPQTTGRDASTF